MDVQKPSQAGRAAVVSAAAPVAPRTRAAIQEVLDRVKAAVVANDFRAFCSEIHPNTIQAVPVEKLAQIFGELVATKRSEAPIDRWELGEILPNKADGGFVAEMKNAPKNVLAAFDWDAGVMKLLAMGFFQVP